MSFEFHVNTEQSSPEGADAVQKCGYIRLVHSDQKANSFILVPVDNQPAVFIQGDFVFPGPEDQVVDALRRFAPVSGLYSGVLPINLLPVPHKNEFELEQPFVRPALLTSGSLACDQELYFVMDTSCCVDIISFDVYLTERFFEAPSLAGLSEESENMHSIRNCQRLRLLLNLGREIVVKENPLLKLLEKNNYSVGGVEEKRNVFGDHTDPKALEQLYAFVRAAHADQQVSVYPDPQHHSLRLEMHEYQKRAVSWMLSKELRAEKEIRLRHPLCFPFETAGDAQLYMHAATGRISRVAPTVKGNRGGILADEMGLGKTLECISLILAHLSPREEPYLPKGPLKNVTVSARQSDTQCFCYEKKTSKLHKRRLPLNYRGRKTAVDYSESEDESEDEFEEESEDEEQGRIPENRTISCVHCGTAFHRKCCGAEFLPDVGNFLCSPCNQTNKTECKTTLIVAPAALLSQWCTEIEKSCSELSYYVYPGISAMGFFSPWELAQYDVVLASYEMLSQEVLYVTAAEKKKTLRRASVRMIIPSPLLSLKFWRFILDEAQMVESESANYVKMAFLISAHFYWAVTGTPIQRSVKDLRSLFGFIEVSPWNIQRWFNEYILWALKASIPDPLYDIVGECMWRLQKRDVEDEMDLPPCKILTHSIAFSGIEMQVYQQVYQDCIKVLGGKLRARCVGENSMGVLDKKFSQLDGDMVRVIKTWMGHLVKLCSSPTRVKYFFREGRQAKKPEQEEDETDSLKRCLHVLLFKAKLALQNSVRTVVYNRNGAAGYLWLDEKFPQAAEQYRTAKRAWTDHEQYVEVDYGQKLHVLVNLAMLIAERRDVIPPTLEDDTLRDKATALNTELDVKCQGNRMECVRKVEDVWNNVPHRPKDFAQAIVGVFSAIGIVNQEDDVSFVQHCKISALAVSSEKFYVHSRALQGCYESSVGLRVMLSDRWKLILEERDQIKRHMESLIANSENSEEFAEMCAECHMRNEMYLRKCQLCLIEKAFRGYEELIFRAMIRGDKDGGGFGYQARRQKLRNDAPRLDLISDDEANRLVTYHDGDFEVVCKAVLEFVRKNYKLDYEEIESEVEVFSTCIETIKKEFKLWSALWSSLGNMVAMRDETRQAILRVRFATEQELAHASFMEQDLKGKNGKAKAQQWLDYRALVRPETLLQEKVKQHLANAQAADTTVQRELTHFKYMRNMHESYVNEELMEKNDCVICQEKVAKEWAVFPCGHILCRECLRSIRNNQMDKYRVTCPVCRSVTYYSEIVTNDTFKSSVNSTSKISRDASCLQLRGAPLKMEAVVRTVFDLNLEEPEAKILIFSDYADVLDDYAGILNRNGVKAVRVKGKAQIPKCIQKLRDGVAKILLMPIVMGGKGLTITEATHLFFLEPLLNKGAELQAIGRIHRMGQTKPTFVHKFIVEKTIEAVLYDMVTTAGQEGNLLQESLTLRQVLQLLKSSGYHGPATDEDAIWGLQTPVETDDSQPSTSQR